MKNALITLKNFIDDMKAYETQWGSLMQKSLDEAFSDESNQKRLAQIIEIQNRYLSKKALSLKQDRRSTLTFRMPPEYDQLIINEQTVNHRTILFDVQCVNDTECRKYTVVLEDDHWKVDKMAISFMSWKATRQIF